MTTADEGPIQLLPTGEIAIAFANGRRVLPRPTFGQIQPLIRAEGHLRDEMATCSNKTAAIASRLLQSLPGTTGEDGKITDDDLPELERIRAESRTAADEVEAEVQRLMSDWWSAVLDLLDPAAPGPDSWPSSFLDPKMPTRMVSHWRFIPVGPG